MAGSIAYFDCFSGISGDMCLGALVDAGVPLDALRAELEKLPLDGWSISATRVKRHAIAASLVVVETDRDRPEHDGHSHHRHLSDVVEIIDNSTLREPIKDSARRIFGRLAEAEAAAHDVSKEEIHFHEVGAVDAIIDVIGTCAALALLGIDEVYASPLPMSRGFVKCEHGVMPVPVPGTLELLEGVPVEPTDLVGELVTPTGAAIVTTLAKAYGPMPAMVVESTGYGAGQRDNAERPNMLRVVVGRAGSEGVSGLSTDRIAIVETNIDDQSPEVFGYIADRLLSTGALDVYYTPIFMKKGRPAYQLTVLAELDRVEEVNAVILAETTTFGVRVSEAQRRKLVREVRTVSTAYGDIRVKVGGSDSTAKASAEYEDCRARAEVAGVPIREVYEAAIRAFRNASEDDADS